MKKINEEKLLQEYVKLKKKPEVILINHQKILIPVEYTLKSTKEEILRAFLRDYLDVQKKDIAKYAKNNLPVEKISWNGMPFVVPFHFRGKNYRDTEIVDYVLERAQAKFEHAVTLTRKMDRAFPERKYTVEIAQEHVDALQNAYDDYLMQKRREKISQAAIKVSDFILSGFRFMKKQKSPFAKSKLNNAARKVVFASLWTGGAVWGISSLQKENHDTDTQNFDKTVLNNAPAENDISVKTASSELFKEMYDVILEVGKDVKHNIQKNQNKDENFTETPSSENIKSEKKSVTKKSSEAAKASSKKVSEKNETENSSSQKFKISKNFKRSEAEKTRLFNKYMKDIFASEGGYADKTIDQPTNMGIIQPTLNSFLKKYPDLAKKNGFPKTVKGLKKRHALLVYRKLYFDFYKIGDYRNESIGMFIYDMYVNHTTASVELFVHQALKAARKAGADISLPKDFREQVAIVNSLALNPKAEKAFYNQLIIERRFFMYKNTTLKVKKGQIPESRFAQGLRNRVNKYEKKYVSTQVQEAAAQQYVSRQVASR